MDLKQQALRLLSAALITGLAGLPCYLHPVVAAQKGTVDLAGNEVNPLQAGKGGVVVLIFVRTDCPISNRYAPEIQRLSRVYDKASFWLVYPDRKEPPEAIRSHDREFDYKIPAVRDLQHTLVKRSDVQITPEAAVFNAEGRLIYHGRIDNLYADFGHARQAATTHELQDAIIAAVNGKAPAADTVPAVGCYITDLE